MKRLFALLSLTVLILVSFSSCSDVVDDNVVSYDVPEDVYITFGHYEQDNNKSNGKEEIEWLVLDTKPDGKMLVISKYALDCQPFEDNCLNHDVSWKNSSLREWLNSSFLNEAFSQTEQVKICRASDGKITFLPSYDESLAEREQIFLLDIGEANLYFDSDELRQCKATDYAIARGVSYNSNNKNCAWWLRDVGNVHRTHAATVDIRGTVPSYNDSDWTIVSFDFRAVRPAMWIDFEANDFTTVGDTVDICEAKTGDYISFGCYDQDYDTENGKEAIEWLVLDVQDGKALIISKYGLDCQEYNHKYKDTTWEDCSLRYWLNNNFLNAAFTESEKMQICTTNIFSEKNPIYGTSSGNETQDKIFLLSINEVNRYFSSDEDRKCLPTPYALEQGVFATIEDDNFGYCEWWLRSLGGHSPYAAYVGCGGDVDIFGKNANYYSAVRPALWIKLNP